MNYCIENGELSVPRKNSHHPQKTSVRAVNVVRHSQLSGTARALPRHVEPQHYFLGNDTHHHYTLDLTTQPFCLFPQFCCLPKLSCLYGFDG